jgi:hypothetical protein
MGAVKTSDMEVITLEPLNSGLKWVVGVSYIKYLFWQKYHFYQVSQIHSPWNNQKVLTDSWF